MGIWECLTHDLPAKGGIIKILLAYRRVTAYRILVTYRLKRHHGKVPVLRSLISWQFRRTQLLTGCYVSHLSEIGSNVKLIHPTGIVIGKGARVGDHVSIYQQVTLGGKGNGTDQHYPVIDSGAVIYSGAKIIGGVHVGKSAIVGCNAVVMKDVPDNSTAVGVPARIL